MQEKIEKYLDNKAKLAAPRKGKEQAFIEHVKANHNDITYQRMRELISSAWYSDVRRNKPKEEAMVLSKLITQDELALAHGVLAKKTKRK